MKPELRSRLRLWIGFFAPPVAWFAHLNVSYALGAWVCREGMLWLLHGATVAALAVGGLGILVGVRTWRSLEAAPGGAALSRPSARFLMWGAVAMGGFFVAVVVVAGAANLVLDPCGAPS